MILDYPELLSGFLVLTGAGYPVRQAWKKQVMDGMKKNSRSVILCTGNADDIKPDGDGNAGDPGLCGIRASDPGSAVI